MKAGTLISQELAKDFYKIVKWFLTGIIRIVKESFSPNFIDLVAEKDTSNSNKSKNSKNKKSDKKKNSK